VAHGSWIAIPLLTLGVFSCGGSTGDAGVTVEQACTDELTAFCKKLTTCAPFFSPIVFGDEATCIERNKASCVKSLSLPNSPTPADAETCVADLNADMDCPKILGHDPPASCQSKPGTAANGAVCGSDWQCQSAYCQTADDMQCGTCTDRATTSGSCTKDENCAYGLVCATGICAAPGAAGAACDKNHPCLSPLACAGATVAVPMGTCAAAAPAGGDCSTAGCLITDGLYCNADKVCQKVQVAQPGEPCGLVDKTLTICSASDCNVSTGQTSGICGAIAADGAACDATNGPKCKPGAKCIGGMCQLTDPSSCK
jgi:hypothetical protein